MINRNAGIWIDHRKAHIVGLNPGGPISSEIHSNLEKHAEHGGVPADDHRQRVLTGELNIYYDAVIEALREYGKLLIIGPGEAKGELHARLSKQSQGGRIAAVETADQMTDRQIVAKVQAYFGTEARP